MDLKQLDRVVRGVALPPWFELFERHYFLLDRDYDFWWFTETLKNGMYTRYTLKGQCLKPDGWGCGSAYLYAKLSFHPFRGETTVYIEDIVTSKRSVQIGSWMMVRFIEFLRAWDRVLIVKRVWGHLSPVDEYEENKERRDAFFKKFGFRIKETERDKFVEAEPENLSTRPLDGIEEIPLAKLVERCVSALSPVTRWAEEG